jgi:S1-C subfamily serine protease
MRFRIATHGVGENVSLHIERGQEKIIKSVVLEKPPAVDEKNALLLTGRHGLSGAKIGFLTEASAYEMGVDYDEGAIIIHIQPHSPASMIGLLPGDMILAINGEKIKDLQDLSQKTRRFSQSLSLVIKRQSQIIHVQLGS